MDGVEYFRSELWIRLEVHWPDPLDVLLALDRVFCFDSEENFCQRRLGKGYIRMTIFNVFVKDTDAIMSNRRWLISE